VAVKLSFLAVDQQASTDHGNNDNRSNGNWHSRKRLCYVKV